MTRKFAVATAAASMIAIFATPAAATGFDIIAGKWCSEFGSQQFFQDKFVVTRKSDGARFDYQILRYDDRGSELEVFWKNSKGDSVSTSYGQFSSDGRRMLQLKTDTAPPIPHRRC